MLGPAVLGLCMHCEGCVREWPGRVKFTLILSSFPGRVNLVPGVELEVCNVG